MAARANPWIASPLTGFDAYRGRGWRAFALAATALALAAMVAVRALQGGGGAATGGALSARIGSAVPQAFMSRLRDAAFGTLDYTGGADPVSLGVRVSRAAGAVVDGPRMLYVGAEFCPYCAAERWSLVLTLLRFGRLSGLRYMASSATDKFPNTPTFTFYGADYTSPYLRFTSVETAGRSPTTPLQPLRGQPLKTFRKYDNTPYVPSQAAGQIPFLDVADRYVWVGAPLLPDQIQHETWDQILRGLAAVGRGGSANANIGSIVRAANIFTAAVCSADGGQPAAVCSAPGVVAAKGGLPR